MSGGIDSSSSGYDAVDFRKPIKTFTIGFNENDYNKSNYTKEIAKFLGTNHEEFIVSPKNR